MHVTFGTTKRVIGVSEHSRRSRTVDARSQCSGLAHWVQAPHRSLLVRAEDAAAHIMRENLKKAPSLKSR